MKEISKSNQLFNTFFNIRGTYMRNFYLLYLLFLSFNRPIYANNLEDISNHNVSQQSAKNNKLCNISEIDKEIIGLDERIKHNIDITRELKKIERKYYLYVINGKILAATTALFFIGAGEVGLTYSEIIGLGFGGQIVAIGYPLSVTLMTGVSLDMYSRDPLTLEEFSVGMLKNNFKIGHNHLDREIHDAINTVKNNWEENQYLSDMLVPELLNYNIMLLKRHGFEAHLKLLKQERKMLQDFRSSCQQ